MLLYINPKYFYLLSLFASSKIKSTLEGFGLSLLKYFISNKNMCMLKMLFNFVIFLIKPQVLVI